MTRDEEHQLMKEAFEEHYAEIKDNPEAIKKFLMEFGIWHLLVPNKPKNKPKKKSKKR